MTNLKQTTLDLAVRILGPFAKYRLISKVQIPMHYTDPRVHKLALDFKRKHRGELGLGLGVWNDKYELTIVEPFSIVGGKMRAKTIQWDRVPNSGMKPENWAARIIMAAWRNIACQPYTEPPRTADFRELVETPRHRVEVTKAAARKLYPTMAERTDERSH